MGFEDPSLLKRMMHLISYRGPDDEGVFVENHVSLGHKRLSIIDLSRLGRQPMMDAENRAVITYNGELFNFKILRKKLQSLGFIFKSQTDTEVVLNAYLAWGKDCLSHFEGMYAFAIWDRHTRNLLLVRDPVGIKPLFYSVLGNSLVFASEIKSILCWSKFKREVNPRALDYFLTFRYNHLNETLFNNINKVPPGNYIEFCLNPNLSQKTHSFWDVPMQISHLGAKDLEEALSQEVEASVVDALVSDVPVGVFLSSGIDSGGITAIMSRNMEAPPNTFTVGFGYDGFQDELNPVRFTADYFKTDHTEFLCKPNMASIIPQVIWSSDELNADPALIPTYLISEVAAKKVKVILSGEGSDELFGGYERYVFSKYGWNLFEFCPLLLKMVPAIAGKIPTRMLDLFFKYSSAIGEKGLDRLSRFCGNFPDIGACYMDIAGIFDIGDKERLYGPKLLKQLREESIVESLNKEFFHPKIDSADELVNRLCYFELKTRLPNDLLAKVDSMTMAHSLEARVPYLNKRLIEFAFSIPTALKINMGREKYILRKSMKQFLPNSIRKRKKDHFFVPIHLWMQNELKKTFQKILTKSNIARSGYLNSDFVLGAFENYQSGALVYSRQLWNILFFMVWHKLYIETDEFLTFRDEPKTLDDLF